MYDEAEASGSLLAGQGNGVGIVDQPDVRQVFELSNGEAAFGIVRRQNPRSGAERWNAVRALLPTIEAPASLRLGDTVNAIAAR